MGDNIVYVSNLPVNANVNNFITLYGKYGEVGRVKFLSQYFTCEEHCEWGELEYPAGVALVQFRDAESKVKCFKDQEPIILNGYILKNEQNGENIQSKFKKCIFLFFTSPHLNIKIIENIFKKYDPEYIEILHYVSLNRPGMAIVQFAREDSRGIVLDDFDDINMNTFNFELNVCQPLYTFEALDFEELDTMPPVVHVPDRKLYNNSIQFERWLDFELRYLDHSPYKVNSFLASQFSSKIREQLMNFKGTTNQNIFNVSVTIAGDFNLIVDSLMGQTIQITPENAIFLLLCAKDLEMQQLESAANQLICDLSNEEITFQFCSELWRVKQNTNLHVEFFAKNFERIRLLPSFKLLPLDIICLTLDSPHLQVTSEEAYSEWLFEFYDKDDTARVRLIPYMLKYMKTFDGAKVRSILSKPGANMNSLREPISQILRSGLGEEEILREQFHNCPFNDKSPSDGIFGYIKEVYGKSASEIINISGSCGLANIIDPSTDSQYYSSPAMQDMWIQFDFKKHPFVCKAYTLKTVNRDDAPHLKSWSLEGSNNEKEWTELHHMDRSDSLKGPGKVQTYSVKKDSEQYRFLRLRQTGANWNDANQLVLQAIEFYGSLFVENNDGNTSKEGLLYSKGKEWVGVFNYLSKKFRTNPIHIGEIKVKSAADPSFLVNPEWSNKFCTWRSPNVPNPFVAFDFHEMKVCVDMYTLKTYQGPNHLRSWVIEGSDDGVIWEEIDNKSSQTGSLLSKSWEMKQFACKTMSKPYSRLRIKMTGQNKSGPNIFWLSYIEFYGKIHISGPNK